MLLPMFILVNVPLLFKTALTYETVETFLLIAILSYKTTASGLYYGFSVEQGADLELSSIVWLLSFIFAKALSKIPHSQWGRLFVFLTIFITFVMLYDPFFFGLTFDISDNYASVVFIILIIEFAYAKWVERRAFPIPYTSFALVFFGLSTVCITLDDSDELCDAHSGFQWDACGRSLSAIAVFAYFIGVRRQEKDKQLLVQNRFKEVSTRSDDDQFI
jgi:hypothetical protein